MSTYEPIDRLHPRVVAPRLADRVMIDRLEELFFDGVDVPSDLRTVVEMVIYAQATMTAIPKHMLEERVRVGIGDVPGADLVSANRACQGVMRAAERGYIIEGQGDGGNSKDYRLGDRYRARLDKFHALRIAILGAAYELNAHPHHPMAGYDLIVRVGGEVVANFLYWNPLHDDDLKTRKSPDEFNEHVSDEDVRAERRARMSIARDELKWR